MWYRVVKAAFGVAKQEKQSNDGSTVSVIAPENMSILNPGNISIINTNIEIKLYFYLISSKYINNYVFISQIKAAFKRITTQQLYRYS